MIYEDDFPPSIALLSHFKRLTDRVLAEVAQENDNLTVNQIQLIAMLGAPMTMKNISDALSMKPSNLTPLVQSCVINNWLERKKLGADQRVISVVLTPEGRALRTRLISQFSAAFRAVSGLSEDQAAKLLKLATLA